MLGDDNHEQGEQEDDDMADGNDKGGVVEGHNGDDTRVPMDYSKLTVVKLNSEKVAVSSYKAFLNRI